MQIKLIRRGEGRLGQAARSGVALTVSHALQEIEKKGYIQRTGRSEIRLTAAGSELTVHVQPNLV